MLAVGGIVTGLFSFTEVPATLLVCPPGVKNVALTMLNNIHYGRNDEIVAMSLYLMLLVAVVITAVQCGWSWAARSGSGLAASTPEHPQ